MARRFIRALSLVAAAMFMLQPAPAKAQEKWIYADVGCEFRFHMPERPETQEQVVDTQEGPQKVPLYWYSKEMHTATGSSIIGVKAYCYEDHPIKIMRMTKDDLFEMLERNARDLEFEHKETYYKEFPEQGYSQATLTGFLRITEESPLIHLSNIYIGKNSIMMMSGDVIGEDGPLSDIFREIMDSAHKPTFE